MFIFDGRKFVERAFLDTRSASGAYVAWLLSNKSAQDVYDWANYIGVINVVPPNEMHSTIIYSPDKKLESDIHGDRPLPMPVALGHYNRPSTRIFGKPDSLGALVTTYDSDLMAARHRYYRDNKGLVNSFEDYIPHVTLSYNAKGQNSEVVKYLMRNPCMLPIHFDVERTAYADINK